MIYSKITFAILLVISLSLSASIASAVIDNGTVQYYADIHNSMINNAPQFVKNLAGNATIDLNVTMNNGSIYRTGFEMKNAQVSKIIGGGVSYPLVSINATEDAVNKITSSNDPLSAFMQEMSNGGIAIQMHDPHSEGKGCPFL